MADQVRARPKPLPSPDEKAHSYRGTEGCFQKWADEVDDQSYTFDRLLPFFKRSYSYTPPDNTKRLENASADYVAEDWDTSGGPLQVSYASWVNPVSTWLKSGFEALGMPSIPSFYGGSLIGWSWLAVTLDPDTQVRSSAQAMLQEAFNEAPNLYIYKSTLARKILFNGTTAIGVIVDSGGLTYNITATREVIVSAGVVSRTSPALLDNSAEYSALDTVSPTVTGLGNWRQGGHQQDQRAPGGGSAWCWAESMGKKIMSPPETFTKLS